MTHICYIVYEPDGERGYIEHSWSQHVRVAWMIIRLLEGCRASAHFSSAVVE